MLRRVLANSTTAAIRRCQPPAQARRLLLRPPPAAGPTRAPVSSLSKPLLVPPPPSPRPASLHPFQTHQQARFYSRGGGRGSTGGRGSPSSRGGGGLSPEQLQLLFRIFGRVLGTVLHAARRRGLHRSRPLLVAGLVMVPLTAGGAFLASHLERAPLSGRLQLVFLDQDQEMELGAMAAAEVLKQERAFVLPPTAPETVLVHDVAVELLRALQDADGPEMAAAQERVRQLEWQVRVIESAVANAFVVPSGAIFVYTALLEQLGTRGALAAVLGHELAHALERHSVEKVGVLCLGSLVVETLGGLFGPSGHAYLQRLLLPLLQGLVLDLPYSRSLEAEADALGLKLMAMAGYAPEEAVEAWRRMEAAAAEGAAGKGGGKGKKQQQQPWEFMSTHPAHGSRIRALTEQLPEARRLQAAAVARKRAKGERVPDGAERIVVGSSTLLAARRRDAAALLERREASAAVALRASSLVVGGLGE